MLAPHHTVEIGTLLHLKSKRPELPPRFVRVDDAPAANRGHRELKFLAGILKIPLRRGPRRRVVFSRLLESLGVGDEESRSKGYSRFGVESEVAPAAVVGPPLHLVRFRAFRVHLETRRMRFPLEEGQARRNCFVDDFREQARPEFDSANTKQKFRRSAWIKRTLQRLNETQSKETGGFVPAAPTVDSNTAMRRNEPLAVAGSGGTS